MRTLDKLRLIAEKARKDKGFKFNSLSHLINEESLSWCFGELKKNKAPGIDGITVLEYGENLEANLKDLIVRMKAKKYRPQPVKRVFIPKPGKKEKRGLGIPSVEDKLVQIMMKKILEAIYEQDFLDFSYGFRPKMSCHQAVNRLDKVVMTRPINYIVEVDIEKFFDNVCHYWLLRGLEERIADPNFLLLVRKFLKAGIIENGDIHKSVQGTPQGGVTSPVLSNIYLHYVLDIWFERKFKSEAKGYAELIRYADDFVACCESKKDADEFLVQLEARLSKFKLGISKEKTSIIKFGRNAWKSHQNGGERVATFTFLGFTHFCTKSRRGKFIMGHKTSKQKLSRAQKEINLWLKKVRNMFLLKDWWKVLKAKLIGHYNYFGISGNMHCLRQFYKNVWWMVFKWINRRSQKKSMNLSKYSRYLDWNPLPQPRISYDMYTLSPSK
jgi:RNA-directed DNA polymerase